MQVSEVEDVLGPALVAALKIKGYAELTAVQEAVLDPALRGRDLRITSQTGSGKTLAIGIALREHVEGLPATHKPQAIVVAPTRELAHQTKAELTWLYSKLDVRVVTTTGGAGYRDEQRSLHRSPTIIVGTPGRLLDHLNRGSIDTSELKAVVLDEADRMLDLGFREDLESIFKHTPKDRRTHLVTATLPRQVRALADKVQTNPAHVEGTRLGAANADIDHVVHLIEPRSGTDAIINLLLVEPDAQTLIFARMRIGVANIARALSDAGFAVASISGELDQAARSRALSAFKAKKLRVLVATDVAARGIDVQDIARVIHADPPTDADSYTHRSGRTGRAGRKGISSLIVSPGEVVQVTRLLRQAGVPHRFEPIPTADMIRSQNDERVIAELTREPTDDQPEPADSDPRMLALATTLVETGQATRVLARLLSRTQVTGATEPRDIRSPEPPRKDRHRDRDAGPPARNERNSRDVRRDSRADARGEAPRERFERQAPRHEAPRHEAPRREASYSEAPRSEAPRSFRERAADRGRIERASGPIDAPADFEEAAFETAARERSTRRDPESEGGYTRFHVSWGGQQGAEPHRLLAMLCRRGGVRGKDIGAIRVEAMYSLVDVATNVAEGFAEAAAKPDPREPRVQIRADRDGGAPAPQAPVGRPSRQQPREEARPPRPARSHSAHADKPHADKPHAAKPHAAKPPAEHADKTPVAEKTLTSGMQLLRRATQNRARRSS